MSFTENSIAYDPLLTEEEIQEMHLGSLNLHDLGEMGYGFGTICPHTSDENSALTSQIIVVEVPLQNNIVGLTFFEQSEELPYFENEEKEE